VTPIHDKHGLTLYCGDALAVLETLPAESAQMCVTSPPYWNLRDYGTATWEGGDEGCSHRPSQEEVYRAVHAKSGLAGNSPSATQAAAAEARMTKSPCPKCGARRIDKQLGLEPTVDEYLANMVAVFRAVKRVLRKDGTCWVNVGDSYASGHSECAQLPPDSPKRPTTRKPDAKGGMKPRHHDGTAPTRAHSGVGQYENCTGFNAQPAGLKPKDLCLIPFRLAIALQADGWWVRSDIIWSKMNPMPESCRDRPTTSHEHVFLLTKAARYYYDADAVREAGQPESQQRYQYAFSGTDGGDSVNDRRTVPEGMREYTNGRNRRTVWTADEFADDIERFAAWCESNGFPFSDMVDRFYSDDAGKPDVWTIPTQSFPKAHFACVDDATECLTLDGWKRHDQLKKGDMIAAYDMQYRNLGFRPCLEVARYDVTDQEMVQILGRGIDQLLTPNHRCIVANRDGVPTIREAAALKSYLRVPVTADWKPGGNEFPTRLAALIGWAVTEGCFGDDCVTIYQSGDVNPGYCQEIRQLLQAEGADYVEASRTRRYKDRDVIAMSWRITGAVAHELIALCRGKRLPPEFLQWNETALTALWDTIMKGDGHFREGGRQTIVQKDRVAIDQFQALAFRLGMSTTLRQRSTKTWALYKTEARWRQLHSQTSQLIQRVTYSGTVWCPQTEFGTFVARRNGRVFITGNTFPERLVEPCIAAGTSECGACPECGAAWERVVETHDPEGRLGKGYHDHTDDLGRGQRGVFPADGAPVKQTTGWRPGCSHYDGRYRSDFPRARSARKRAQHDAWPGGWWDRVRRRPGLPEWDTVPCVVADIFCGSGTTGLVCRKMGRKFIGIELSKEYCKLAVKRMTAPLGKQPRQPESMAGQMEMF